MKRFLAPLTPDLARAARALTQVSVEEISEAAALDPTRVRGFEHRGSGLDQDSRRKLRSALEEFGAVFFDEDDQGGYGVRRKYNAAKTRQLDRWEGEGGPAYEDDI
ncbi:XRE family transcriptional regulator [Nesterenkonia sp. E16_7]|uniref:XRE family transcriptional regulator n=1 Tax=unclassified Nesterenkonia TaxID=2629769 RepID=UPI001A92B4EA|nr:MULTISPECIES: XRE family transcriptional regulator [unclassified Nesterenkonia]MBO0594978.1 XRE family transcriptional regulator [Nesterenkonia sp. E16_10]MBO0598633.1 XRE family transcriptional regulator [Nesterenkonia sp. E16_7]